LIGGDNQAADEIEQEVNNSRIRVKQLKELVLECNCSEELIGLIQEQIQNMETEQNRLQELAQNEKRSMGMFGWLFALLDRQ